MIKNLVNYYSLPLKIYVQTNPEHKVYSLCVLSLGLLNIHFFRLWVTLQANICELQKSILLLELKYILIQLINYVSVFMQFIKSGNLSISYICRIIFNKYIFLIFFKEF